MKKVVCKNSATGRTMEFEYGDVVFLEGVDDIGAANFTIARLPFRNTSPTCWQQSRTQVPRPRRCGLYLQLPAR